MNSGTLPVLIALVVQFSLAATVFQANPRRKANQAFLLLSLAIECWLLSLYQAFSASNLHAAEIAIRSASASGAFILAAFDLLRLSIREKQTSWRVIVRASWPSLTAAVAVALFCQTNLFLQGAAWPSQPVGTLNIPVPVPGPFSVAYAIYFVAAVIVLIINTGREVRSSVGREQAELAFILIIGITTLVVSLPLGIILGHFLDPVRVLWFAPFRVLVFSLVIAYGIATRKVMEVGFFLRRGMSYLLLSTYLVALYAVVWWLVSRVVAPASPSSARTFAHVAASLAVAFALAPARGVSQSFANRLFVGTRGLDFRSTMNKATAILRSVTTLRDLLERFGTTIQEAVGSDHVIILLAERSSFIQAYPPQPDSGSAIGLTEDSGIVQYLRTQPEALVSDELHRIRATDNLETVLREMNQLSVSVAMPIFAREHLEGIMLLGPRVSGRIYGSVEQNALQVLCGQLAVAVENAQLFTEVQNARIYNETLLQNLTTGVIAIDAEGGITVFNQEAEQITDRPWHDLVDRSMDDLPEQLLEILQETLRSGKLQEHREVVLRSGEKTVVVRASSSIFHDQSGQMLGALMVLTDITAVKRLERQIRRSDRLASLGTLSAGMAHEIKNPLVSIKTFAQLLPERYQDSDFRETFSNLIGHEIDRIDSLVNQLLRFARPAKPLLKPMHVHAILEKSLLLVGHRLYQKEIKLSRSWSAEVDTIRADEDQLEQVFLNFFLNAMDAMTHGGELTVATEIRSSDEWAGGIDPLNSLHGKSHEVLRITVRDDGEGIRGEDIPHVFDPFFTTKDYGTGLGLSVVHGIIQEHGGQIEVESELSRGTAFYILLPLVRFEEEVAAA